MQKKRLIPNLYLLLVKSSFNVKYDDVQLQMIIQEHQIIFLYLDVGS